MYAAKDALNARTNCKWRTRDGGTTGSSRFPSKVRQTERQRQISKQLLVGLVHYPFLRWGALLYFDVSFDVFIGEAQPSTLEAAFGRGRGGLDAAGGGGLWICYSDIDPANLAAILRDGRLTHTIARW